MSMQARMILEILGRPKEHVADALKGLVEKIGKEKGVKILEKHIHEPLEVKDSKDLFTSFTELVLECDSISTFFGIVFAYMPANIELIEPTEITLKNEEFTLLASRIVQRLHNYDAIARKFLVENQMLKEKMGLPSAPEKEEKSSTKKKSKAKSSKKQKKK